MPRAVNYAHVLQDSPLLSSRDIQALFPTPEQQKALVSMQATLKDYTDQVNDEAATWEQLDAIKDTVLKVLNKAVGLV